MAHALEGIVREVGEREGRPWAEVELPHPRFNTTQSLIVPGAGMVVGKQVLVRIISFAELIPQEEEDGRSTPDRP